MPTKGHKSEVISSAVGGFARLLERHLHTQRQLASHLQGYYSKARRHSKSGLTLPLLP